MSKPTIPSGTRDFGPAVMQKRLFIFGKIRGIFERFGFLPLETPAMENLSVLTGKYGDEGDQLLFKILNSGDFLKDVEAPALASYKKALPHIAEKGLRYDLTVPFARYTAMNRGQLTFPFKRYQIQPVWRSDRPQKGRYREFYQCDADVIGTDSLLCETEMLVMIGQVMQALGISQFKIKLNNRKVLTGLSEIIGQAGREAELCVAIDKLDKIGWEKVREELEGRGFEAKGLDLLNQVLDFNTENPLADIAALEKQFANSAIALEGLAEIRKTLEYLQAMQGNLHNIEVDVRLARGLSYYTGCIVEVKALGVNIGSISGGGRYDNLTGVFGIPGLSGAGISFGVDRIYDVMEELNLFPDQAQQGTRILLCHFDEENFSYCLPLAHFLRQNGIQTEIYPETGKIKKQLSYADARKIPFAGIVGSEEMESQTLTLKNLINGEQQRVSKEALLALLQD
jgi:histidyl-tRNA synthetase